MNHAEAITDRILLLNGLPNYQRLFSLKVGQTLREQFEELLGAVANADALASFADRRST